LFSTTYSDLSFWKRGEKFLFSIILY